VGSNREPDRNYCDDDEPTISPEETTERILRWPDRIAETEGDDEHPGRMNDANGEADTDGSSGGHAFGWGPFWLLCYPEKTSGIEAETRVATRSFRLNVAKRAVR
jgi:hypothetical protein